MFQFSLTLRSSFVTQMRLQSYAKFLNRKTFSKYFLRFLQFFSQLLDFFCFSPPKSPQNTSKKLSDPAFPTFSITPIFYSLTQKMRDRIPAAPLVCRIKLYLLTY